MLQEREARQALAGDWLAAAETLFQRTHARSGKRQDEVISERLFGYLLRLDTATLPKPAAEPATPTGGSGYRCSLSIVKGLTPSPPG